MILAPGDLRLVSFLLYNLAFEEAVMVYTSRYMEYFLISKLSEVRDYYWGILCYFYKYYTFSHII